MSLKQYTLPELAQKVDKEFFTPQEVSYVLRSDPQSIRVCARQRPDLLGFPIMIVGNRVKIPRIPFLRFMGVNI